LEDIATRDGYTVPQLCTRLYDELVAERGAVDNFTSFLRVCCTRYLALQLSGEIPQDVRIPIRSLTVGATGLERHPTSAALHH
ncbi:MAG: ribbon-helix-helix domain-containing protein, partial [Comamonas sp.]